MFFTIRTQPENQDHALDESVCDSATARYISKSSTAFMSALRSQCPYMNPSYSIVVASQEINIVKSRRIVVIQG